MTQRLSWRLTLRAAGIWLLSSLAGLKLFGREVVYDVFHDNHHEQHDNIWPIMNTVESEQRPLLARRAS